MRKFPMRVKAAMAVLMLGMAVVAPAQNYPSKPVRLVVDGPAGGVNDIWARRYAQRMAESMHQPVVVDNRPGASGSLAAEGVAAAPADGYTILYGGLNPVVIYPATGGVVRYDPVKDFVPVALATIGYPILAVNPSLGINSVADLVARLKAQPDELICGTSGKATMQHFACEMFAKAAGVKLRTVPYKGSSPALVDVAAGQIQIGVGYPMELEAFVQPGKLKLLAVYAPKRLPRFPDVPSLTELGYAGLEFPSFSAFFAPKGTPMAAIETFNRESIRAMQQADMTEWVKGVGGIYQPMSPAEIGSFVRSQIDSWRKMVDLTGIRIE